MPGELTAKSYIAKALHTYQMANRIPLIILLLPYFLRTKPEAEACFHPKTAERSHTPLGRLYCQTLSVSGRRSHSLIGIVSAIQCAA